VEKALFRPESAKYGVCHEEQVNNDYIALIPLVNLSNILVVVYLFCKEQ
jgi:hypothetical protein